MRKFLYLILLLAAIAAGYWFWNEKKASRPQELPKEALQLDDVVEVGVKADGLVQISATNWNDLLFAQGMQHGLTGGQKLVGLRELFKGNTSPALPGKVRSLNALFYWLDLSATATECKRLYPPYLLALLESYVAGLNQTTKATPVWSVDDVLLMQRGYAFLLDRAWRKEWGSSQLRSYLGPNLHAQVNGFDAPLPSPLGKDASQHPDLNALLGRPFFRITRIREPGGKLSMRYEAQAFWAFLFQPSHLQLGESADFKGLALVGLPFLQSAQTSKLGFVCLPIADRNESFAVLPMRAISESDGQRNEAAPARTRYGEAPFHIQGARLVSQLVIGAPNSDFYYHWDGMRPSADLLTAYLLLNANDMDEAISALSHHQVPALELTLSEQNGGVRTLELRGEGSSPDKVLSLESSMFRSPKLSSGFDGLAIRGFDFTAAGKPNWEEPHHYSNQTSPMDEELAQLTADLLETRVQSLIPEKLRKELRGQLKAAPSPSRDYFIRLLWRTLCEKVGKAILEEHARELEYPLEIQMKKLVLLAVRANYDDSTPINRYISDPRQFLVDGIQTAYAQFMAASAQQPPFPFHFEGASKAFSSELLCPSPDAPLPIFFADRDQAVDVATLYLLRWGEAFEVWSYPFAKDRSLGQPKLSPFNAKSLGKTQIKPKI